MAIQPYDAESWMKSSEPVLEHLHHLSSAAVDRPRSNVWSHFFHGFNGFNMGTEMIIL